MGYQEHAPSPPLRAFVQCYWSRQCAPGEGPRRHRVLPDGAIDLVFDFGAAGAAEEAQLVGTMTRALVVEGGGAQDFLGVRFRPGRAAAFLRLDALELTDRSLALGDVWGAGGRALAARLAEAPSLAARLRVLDRELAWRLAGAGRADPYVSAAVDHLQHTRGRATLAELERRTGVSAVWLRRGFARHVGIAPKLFARVVRLQALLASLEAEAAPRWAELAPGHHFADQAHLAREFSALAGLPPTAYLRERFRFLQEDGPSRADLPGQEVAP